MGILDSRIVRETQPEAKAGSSLSCLVDRQDTFKAALKQLTALIESRETQIETLTAEVKELRQKLDAAAPGQEAAAQRAQLEERLAEAAAREAIWMTVLEWYAAGPFGQRAADAVAQSPSEDAARIRRERELLIAPLLRFESASSDGRAVKIAFRDEAEAKAFRKALERFVPANPYFGMVW